jgi:hypothetical protein
MLGIIASFGYVFGKEFLKVQKENWALNWVIGFNLKKIQNTLKYIWKAFFNVKNAFFLYKIIKSFIWTWSVIFLCTMLSISVELSANKPKGKNNNSIFYQP